MQATIDHFANRCLPLLMANQSGWLVLNSHSFRAIWDGGEGPESTSLMYLDGQKPYPASSTFGYGIVTFNLPYLFRTSAGYNLLVRGPANLPKDGLSPLEGLVETDWAVATFTMSWKITRANQVITFNRDEPICLLVPQRRNELERFKPSIIPIENDQELNRHFVHWSTSRRLFRAHQGVIPRNAGRRIWQKHYLHGSSPSGASAPEHQRKRGIRAFTDAPLSDD
jgi:hypothetical protein